MTRRTLSEHDSKRLLARYGIAVTREVLAASRAEALAAGAALGFPVAAKACHAALAHKTEAGLVRLGLVDATALGAAYDALAPHVPAGGGVLVQEMVAGKRELILGLVRDPVFGPCVSIGVGGIFAEALADVAFAPAPLDRADAHVAIEALRAQALLGPLRGLPAADRDALADMLVALGEIGIAHPHVVEIDINPVILRGADPVAVDALVVEDDACIPSSR